MAVSLYAHGPASIEVGKYGMSLADARKAFEKTLEECGIKTFKVTEKDHSVGYTFQYSSLREILGPAGKLLMTVAEVMDLHGDPPLSYSLVEEKIPDGEYVLTGCYND